VGIPPEHLPHIFDRFYRGHTGGNAGGLGIGLYVSRQIVELHGGRIEAACPEAGGTCLTVTLPTSYAPAKQSFVGAPDGTAAKGPPGPA
jgi:signal transduction histidine kinase